jgi:hypothetical protein
MSLLPSLTRTARVRSPVAPSQAHSPVDKPHLAALFTISCRVGRQWRVHLLENGVHSRMWGIDSTPRLLTKLRQDVIATFSKVLQQG